MTDYYPFLVREVSKLHSNLGESRREAYERAREELAAKLHQPALRIPESEVAGELRAFDTAVRRIEAEIAGAQTLETGVPASMTSRTSSDSTGSIPITTSVAVEALETTQTEVEASQKSGIGEAKSAPLAQTANADSVLNRQMLQAIGTALDLAVRLKPSTNAIGKKQTESQPIEANLPDPSSRKALGVSGSDELP